MSYSNESEMYPDIIKSISAKMDFFGYKYKVYETWHKNYSDLNVLYPNVKSILRNEVLPDITVLYKNSNDKPKCLIIEVKKDNITVKDIAQAKIYCDIFNAESGLLVSPKNIRKSFIEFSLINKHLLKCANGAQLYTCKLDNKQLQTQNCFPSDGGWIK